MKYIGMLVGLALAIVSVLILNQLIDDIQYTGFIGFLLGFGYSGVGMILGDIADRL